MFCLLPSFLPPSSPCPPNLLLLYCGRSDSNRDALRHLGRPILKPGGRGLNTSMCIIDGALPKERPIFVVADSHRKTPNFAKTSHQTVFVLRAYLTKNTRPISLQKAPPTIRVSPRPTHLSKLSRNTNVCKLVSSFMLHFIASRFYVVLLGEK